MKRLLLLLLPALLFAANIKLFLKDGSFHIVSEYKVEGEARRSTARRR